MQTRRALGEDLAAARVSAASAGQRLDLRTWIYARYPTTRRDEEHFARTRKRCYRLLHSPPAPVHATPRGLQGGAKRTRTRRIDPKRRFRDYGGGRHELCPEIGSELYAWFIDTVRNVRGRMGNDNMLAQAAVIAADMREHAALLAARGERVPRSIARLPVLNLPWLARWRRQYGISNRCISIVFKVARETLKMRLFTFWCNCIRVRAFHEELFGPDKLRFRAYDQKPLWFNAEGGGKTLAPTALREVYVRENMAATRVRFTDNYGPRGGK